MPCPNALHAHPLFSSVGFSLRPKQLRAGRRKDRERRHRSFCISLHARQTKQRNRVGCKYRWFCSVFAQAQAEAYAT